MKLIKHIFSYIGLLSIIVITLAAIYFRSVLFPVHINEPVDEILSKISANIGMEIPSYRAKADIPTSNSENKEVTQVAKGSVNAETDGPNEISDEADTGIVTAITKSVTNTVNDLLGSDENKESDMQEEDGQSETVVGKEDKSSGVKSMAGQAARIVEDSIEYLADKVSTSDDVGAPDSGKMLVQARKAFWNGDMEGAEKLYSALTEHKEPGPNVYGELGNIYYAQGKWQDAGRAYYEAAVRLMELDRPYQVNYLLRVIQGLDAESAEKLRQKISGQIL